MLLAMEQPTLVMNNSNKNIVLSEPNSMSQQQQQQINMKKMKMKGTGSSSSRIPTAEELISHYESQGMDTKQASIKVIGDLQKALFRVVTTRRGGTSQQQQHEEMGVNGGLLRRLDMKIDLKPGYPQMLGIGVASAAVFRGLETFVVPQVIASFANIWKAVGAATTSNSNNNI